MRLNDALLLISLSFFTLTAAGLALAGDCDPKAVLASTTKAYRASDGSLWIAPTARAKDLFKSLKMSEVDLTPALKEGQLANLGPCPHRGPAKGSYRKEPFATLVHNQCEAEIAKKLKMQSFSPAEDNFGSMEAGVLVSENDLYACTDGHHLVPCADLKTQGQSDLSRGCWKGLAR